MKINWNFGQNSCPIDIRCLGDGHGVIFGTKCVLGYERGGKRNKRMHVFISNLLTFVNYGQ